MADLILRPTGRAGRFALQLRYHGPVETDYLTLANVSYETALEIVGAGPAFWLHGAPDPWQVERARRQEKAKKIRAETRWLDD